MFWAECVIFSLLTMGLFALGGVSKKDLHLPKRRTKKKPLTHLVRESQGKLRKGILGDGGEVDRLLEETGQTGKRKQMIYLSAIMLAAGTVIPLLLGNPYLSPVSGIAVGFLPLFLLRQRKTAFQKNRNAELETAVSVITTSYLRTENLTQSVRENLPYMGASVREVFDDFVHNTEMINANPVAGLQRLKSEIPNAVFAEWCDSMTACQSDRTLKHTLLPTLEKFSDVRVVQSRLETLLSEPRREAITMMVLVAANIPLLYFLNKDWYAALVSSVPGQIVLAVCAAVVLFSFVQTVRLSKPIEYR